MGQRICGYAALFLEDDAVPFPAGGPEFVRAVLMGLRDLPADWQFWTLYSPASRTPGRPAGPGKSVLRSGFGTQGWVVRRSAVPALVAALERGLAAL